MGYFLKINLYVKIQKTKNKSKPPKITLIYEDSKNRILNTLSLQLAIAIYILKLSFFKNLKKLHFFSRTSLCIKKNS
jgi:hypothetical protein